MPIGIEQAIPLLLDAMWPGRVTDPAGRCLGNLNFPAPGSVAAMIRSVMT